MFPRNRFSILAALAASAFSSIVGATALEPKHLPADTKWVIHIDMDAARDSKTYDTVASALFAQQGPRNGIDFYEKVTDSKFPEDLNDVTLYGAAAGDEAGVVVIHAKIDRKHVEELVKENQAYSSAPYHGYDVISWVDNNQTSYGAFHDDGTIIIAKKAANVQAALDALDDKGETLKPTDPMVAGLKPKQLVYVGAKDLKDLHAPDADSNPMVQTVQVGWAALTEDDKGPILTAELTADNADDAKKLKRSVDGLVALLGMMGGGQNADPVAKAAVAATVNYDSKQADAVVDVTMPVPGEKFADLIDAISKKHGGH
jgi:hypothetical protein